MRRRYITPHSNRRHCRHHLCVDRSVAFSSALQNPAIPAAAVANSGTYYVTVTKGSCTSTDSVAALVKPLPVVTAGSNSPVCSGAGNTISLTATPAATAETFGWSGPNGFTSPLQDPSIAAPVVLDSGIYKVVTTLNGCSDSATENVLVNGTPAIPTAGQQ